MSRTSDQARGLPGWLVALTTALAAVGLTYLGWQRLRPPAESHRPPEAEIVVRYEGRNWIPVDAALAAPLPAEQMVRVGMDGRLTLWANKAAGLGGGGGPAPAGLQTGPYHRIYVRLDDGRYLPMMWMTAAPDRR